MTMCGLHLPGWTRESTETCVHEWVNALSLCLTLSSFRKAVLVLLLLKVTLRLDICTIDISS